MAGGRPLNSSRLITDGSLLAEGSGLEVERLVTRDLFLLGFGMVQLVTATSLLGTIQV